VAAAFHLHTGEASSVLRESDIQTLEGKTVCEIERALLFGVSSFAYRW
jgi:hypothetical protein